jgi:hypothetical protein
VLDYLGSDPDARVSGCKWRGQGTPGGSSGFYARRVEEARVVIKGGLSDEGARLVLSHTGSLGGDGPVGMDCVRRRRVGSRYLGHGIHMQCLLHAVVCPTGGSAWQGGKARSRERGDTAEGHGFCCPPSTMPCAQRYWLPARPGSSARNP